MNTQKIQLSLSIAALSLSIGAALITTAAFAQEPNTGTSNQYVGNSADEAQSAQPRTDRRRLFKAGGIGCLTGGAVAFLAGKRDQALAGCAVGAAVGSFASYREQLNEARELADAAKAAGMSAQVDTKTVEAEGKQADALDRLSIAYDPASMSSRDPKTVAVLDKIAGLAQRSKTPLTITVEGRDYNACQVPLAQLYARNAFPPATAVDRCGQGEARILISPVPDVG